MSVHETWAPIPEHPGYLASDQGRIASVKSGSSRILRQYFHPDGHMFVCPYVDGARTNRYVHSLVLLTFVGPRPGDAQARHLDGVPTNNTLRNLRYGTQSENMLDRVSHGRDEHVEHTHCPAGHPFDVDNTYRMPSEGYRRCRLCRAESKRRSVIRRRAPAH